jgi:hypothetical protein
MKFLVEKHGILFKANFSLERRTSSDSLSHKLTKICFSTFDAGNRMSKPKIRVVFFSRRLGLKNSILLKKSVSSGVLGCRRGEFAGNRKAKKHQRTTI